jgi:FkbM family methyltransferase
MSTKYFILRKSAGSRVNDNTENQVVFLNNGETHILPQTNLEYYVGRGLFESSLIEWCKQFCNQGKAFLDIGAHSGTYSISLADNCAGVYSFEPQKMTYYALCGGVALSGKDNITCFQYGLGSPDQVGQKTLNIVSNDGGGSTVQTPETMPILREEVIEIRTLDSFALENIGFIKMDVEENELYVLKGALETLKRNQYPTILFESNYENHALFSFIKEIGYAGIISVAGCNNMFLTVRK